MRASPLPLDEAARLRALRSLDILDTPPESFSDAVASAAAAIANAPISAISLVDAHRQWFKAERGLAASETPRDVSFCAHAIHSRTPLIIPDALADARFRDNPLVTGAPHVRSYTGFPLIVGGHAIGALCVIDDQPRTLSLDVLDQLQGLADDASSWLDERRRGDSTLDRTRHLAAFQSLTDTITGLPGRLVFQDRLEQAVARCDRTRSGLAVLLIEVSVTLAVDPTAVQAPAPERMREIADRLKRAVRSTDSLGRVGDDQFGIVMESLRCPEDSTRLASEICQLLGEPYAGDPAASVPVVGVGVALYPLNGPVRDLMVRASAALTALRGSDTAFRFFEPQIDARAQAKAAMLAALRVATDTDQFVLHYQPCLLARDGELAGVEALLRWQHPEHGHVGPAVFIPLAEGAGLINRIGSWVLREALRQMRRWADADRPLRVAVNLSLHQLRDSFAAEVAAELQATGVDPGLLTFEVTESVAMHDAELATATLDRLRALGVRISIDDFGTGYSSLSRLRKLPVHEVKIDRSFVIDLAGSDDARLLVKGIIDLAHALRLEVVAEGVETVAQRDELLRLGCDALQGYLFARPMGAEALETWVSEHRHWRGPASWPAPHCGSDAPNLKYAYLGVETPESGVAAVRQARRA